jgi:hypothetical protein
MEGEEIADVHLSGQGIHEGQFRAAGIAEDVLDSFLLEDLQESLPAGDQRHIDSFLTRGIWVIDRIARLGKYHSTGA